MDDLDQEEIECLRVLERLHDIADVYFWKRFNRCAAGQAAITVTVVAIIVVFDNHTVSQIVSYSSLLYTSWVLWYIWKLSTYKNRFLNRVNNIPTDFQFNQTLEALARTFDAEFCLNHAKSWVLTTLEEDV